MNESSGLIGAVEAGGTKFVCIVGTSPDHVIQRERFPTTSPKETIERMVSFFTPFADELKAIGVASFGPIDLNVESPTYGFISATPKAGWSNTDLLGPLRDAFDIPVGFDTDVNGAAVGEAMWGAGVGLDTIAYLTVGTGIGGGGLSRGNPLHGLVHPEMGHMVVRRHSGDTFEGNCSFHQDCLEGLAAGPAIEGRWGARGETIEPDHPAWEMEAWYLAQAVVNLVTILSPQRVILGGGVMHQAHLFPLIRRHVKDMLAGYVSRLQTESDFDQFIVPPGLGNRAGSLGALALGIQSLE